jgi:hypothetical protein
VFQRPIVKRSKAGVEVDVYHQRVHEKG